MAKILALAHAVPDQEVPNAALQAFMDTSDEWISQRSGIRARHWYRRGSDAFQSEGNVGMVSRACKNLFLNSLVGPEKVDGIVYATISSDFDFPGSSTLLVRELGLTHAPTIIEVRNQCSGFLYALMLANSYIESGRWKHALVIGAEIQSSGLNLSTVGRNTAVLFGDGGGAVLLGPSESGQGILSIRLEADGSFADKLGIRAPSFARACPISAADFEGDEPWAFPHMDGKFVFKMASLKMPEVIQKVLAQNGVTIKDVALIVPHQANQRILEMLGAQLGCPEKVFSNIAKYGNTTAGSIPLALSEAVAHGKIKRGDLICFATFGSGFSWGAALIRW